MRVFVAVCLESKVINKISEVLDQLAHHVAMPRRVRSENIHLTLKFLGDVDEHRIGAIGHALREAARPFSPFIINAKGLGVFPGLKRPQVLWVGVENHTLYSLTSALETGLEIIGFARDDRSFKPHLSVARWRHFRGSSAGLKREIERWKNHEFGLSTVQEIVLFQSMLSSDGAEYRALQVIGLRG